MTDAQLRNAITEIANRPEPQWRPLLAKRFPTDPLLVEQALLWMHADRDADRDDSRPQLGEPGDDRYDLQVMLDRGATSCVWQAYDRKLGRMVAIKILDANGLDQVLTEARAACDVISDHVVRTLDVHEGEPPYIVMELVGEHDPERGEIALGTAASECVPENVREVATWVMRVARGVHDAHLRNVFHRDLKPRNVLITPISRKARIADFGLAVSAPTDASQGATPLVRSGPSGPLTVQGTPEYMAPEQAQGLPLDLDPRDPADRNRLVAIDVWGLGALAYSLLSSRGPWGPRGSGIVAWERATSGEPPLPLDRAAWGERIPRRLRRILERAMARDPHARYPSAAHVANDLEAFLAKQPTSFERSRGARFVLWCRRNPQLTLAAGVAAALVILVVATHQTVVTLRAERVSLLSEVDEQQASLDHLHHNVDQTRHELAATQDQLRAGAADLANLQQSVEEERTLHETVLQAKEHDLRAATAATRQLVTALDAAKADKRGAETQRALYESYWKHAQKEIERVTREREKIRKERDALREERERLVQERDAAISDREATRKALDRVQHELERLNTSDARR